MANTGMRSGFEQTLSFLSDIKQLNTLGELTVAVKKVSSIFGVERVLAGFIPRGRLPPTEQLRHVLLADWPEEWADIYFQKGLLYQDPTVRKVLRSDPAFLWSDLSTASDIGTGEKLVMDRAKDFRLGNGCTVPLLSLDGQHAGFSFAGTYIDDSPDAKGAMTLISSFAFGRALELRNNALRASVNLTPREREVIAWIAGGKTDWEISVIMGVSEKAIMKHAHNIRIKLGAVNRAHAVAESFRVGLLT
jgi:LuxR family transcriptional regulator, quorum-sensing system regulator BjaR1